jgi:hypothetical protein
MHCMVRKRDHERIFRLFASTSGKQLKKIKGDSIQKIGYTRDICKNVNTDITKEKTPDWLDKSWYIELVQKRVKFFCSLCKQTSN